MHEEIINSSGVGVASTESLNFYLL